MGHWVTLSDFYLVGVRVSEPSQNGRRPWDVIYFDKDFSYVGKGGGGQPYSIDFGGVHRFGGGGGLRGVHKMSIPL